MRNTIISYANLSQDVKMAFKEWLEARTRDLISFPFRGKHMRGYIFNHDQNNYLVISPPQFEDFSDTFFEDLEPLDINEEI